MNLISSQNKVCLGNKTSDDLGYGDEIKEEPAAGISAESFYSKPAAAKKRPKNDPKIDPKIMLLQEVKVKLERLPLKEAMDGFSRIKVSPPRKRKSEEKGDSGGGWFAKRSKADKGGGANLDVYFGNPRLIRPPILNVNSKVAAKSSGPFLPQPPTSGYLFGGDEFERVSPVVTDSEEEVTDSDTDTDIEVIEVKKKEEKDGFEAAAAVSPIIKIEDEISAADPVIVDPVIQKDPVILKPTPEVPPPVKEPTVLPEPFSGTIPLLMRMKKETLEKADPAKIRFPAPSSGNRSMIECKWTDCQMSFTTHGKLSDHLRVSNI